MVNLGNHNTQRILCFVKYCANVGCGENHSRQFANWERNTAVV